VATLLAPPPAVTGRRRPAASEALASAGLARVQATPAPPEASRGRWSWEDRRRVLTGTGAVVALLAAVALAVHGSRRRA
jgi:hypothetical protein